MGFISSVQFSGSVLFSQSVVSGSWWPMDRSMPGFPVHHQIPELAQTQSTESVMPSNHLIFCCHLLLLPSIFPSIRVFSHESVFASGGQSFSFSISPSNEYSGQFSFRINWFNLLAVWGTLKSLLQHHSSKASVLVFSPSIEFLFQLLYFKVSNFHLILLQALCFLSEISSFFHLL